MGNWLSQVEFTTRRRASWREGARLAPIRETAGLTRGPAADPKA